MLEYNFTQLDDDYVTVHSRYLITCDVNLVIDDIEKLAEKGQLNAMRFWYLVRTQGQNSKIDNIACQLKGENYNEMLVLQRYYRNDEEWYDLLKAYNEAYDKVYYSTTHSESLVKQKDDAIKNLCKHKSFVYLLKARDVLKCENFSVNWFVQSRLLSVEYDFEESFGSAIKGSWTEVKECRRWLKKNKKLVIKKLMEQYKQEKQKNPDLKPSDNPQLFYILGRTLLFFSKNERERVLGTSFLQALSQRELLVTKTSTTFSIQPKPQSTGKEKNVADRLFEKVYNETMNKNNIEDDYIQK